MTLLEATAEEMGAEVGLDPIIVVAIISAIVSLAPLCLSPTPRALAEHFAQDTRATRRQLKAATHKAWKDCRLGGHPSAKLVRAVQERMSTMCEDDLAVIMEQAA